MKAITLRDIPEPIAKKIEEKARRSGTSFNKTVIEMLLDRHRGKRTVHHDLDHLAGSWSQQEAGDFENVLDEQRAIDPEMWR